MRAYACVKPSILAPRSFHDETQHVKLDPHVFHPQARLSGALYSVSQQAVAQLRGGDASNHPPAAKAKLTILGSVGLTPVQQEEGPSFLYLKFSLPPVDVIRGLI